MQCESLLGHVSPNTFLLSCDFYLEFYSLVNIVSHVEQIS